MKFRDLIEEAFWSTLVILTLGWLWLALLVTGRWKRLNYWRVHYEELYGDKIKKVI